MPTAGGRVLVAVIDAVVVAALFAVGELRRLQLRRRPAGVLDLTEPTHPVADGVIDLTQPAAPARESLGRC